MATNGLSKRIDLVLAHQNGEVFPSIEADFSMCNPPFYESESELQTLAGQKAAPPHSVGTSRIT